MSRYNFGCFRCGKGSIQELKNHQGYVWCPYCLTRNSVGDLLLDDILFKNKENERLQAELAEKDRLILSAKEALEFVNDWHDQAFLLNRVSCGLQHDVKIDVKNAIKRLAKK